MKMLARRFLVGRMNYHLALLADADASVRTPGISFNAQMHNPPLRDVIGFMKRLLAVCTSPQPPESPCAALQIVMPGNPPQST